MMGCRLFLVCLVVSILCGCSDANLYGKGLDDPSADRLGLKGRVCTEDPREAHEDLWPQRRVARADGLVGRRVEEPLLPQRHDDVAMPGIADGLVLVVHALGGVQGGAE